MKKIKTILLVSTCYYFIENWQLNAHPLFSLEEFSSTTYTQHYNALPAVEDADKQIQSTPKFIPFLKEAEKLITHYDLEANVGLRLIHRHFLVAEKNIMAENYEIFKDVPSLVTYAHTLEEAQGKKALPSSWIFSSSQQDNIQIFEASSDPAVKEGINLIEKESEFMDEMGKLLTANDLNSLLSVAILRRSSLEPTQEDQLFVELNNASSDKSIVQLWDAKKVSENTIRTSWSFKGPRQQYCYPISVCERYHPLSGHCHSTKHRKV